MQDYRNATGNRTSMLIGIGLSLLLHALGLWLLIERPPVIEKTAVPGADKAITVTLAPPAAATPPAIAALPHSAPAPAPAAREAKKPPSKPTARKKPAEKKTAKASKPARVPPVAAKAAPRPLRPEAPQPPVRAADAAPSNDSLPDDMFTQVEAARKRRAEARAREGAPESPDPASAQNKPSDDNSIARANIEFSMQHAQGKGRDDVGGVFELRNVGYRNAEILFKGWSERSHRNALRLIPVEKGTQADIQLAIVNKVIDVIREEKRGDFVWESHRLGRDVTLSARPQDTAELRQFLIKEFFPDYVPPPGKG